MLVEEQVRDVWKQLIDAEIHTYYFGDLAGFYVRQKQMVTFLSLFLSCSAVVAVLSKAPAWITAMMSIVVALATAYALAFDLDQRIMAEFNHSWAEVASDYERIWESPYTAESEALYSHLGGKSLRPTSHDRSAEQSETNGEVEDRVLELRNLKSAK